MAGLKRVALVLCLLVPLILGQFAKVTINYDQCNGDAVPSTDVHSYMFLPFDTCLSTPFGYLNATCDSVTNPFITFFSDADCTLVTEAKEISTCFNFTTAAGALFPTEASLAFECFASPLPTKTLNTTAPQFNETYFVASACSGDEATPTITHELATCTGETQYDVADVTAGLDAGQYLLKTTFVDGCGTTGSAEMYQFVKFGTCLSGVSGSSKMVFNISEPEPDPPVPPTPPTLDLAVKVTVNYDACKSIVAPATGIHSYYYLPVDKCIVTPFGFLQANCTDEGVAPLITTFTDNTCATVEDVEALWTNCANDTKSVVGATFSAMFTCVQRNMPNATFDRTHPRARQSYFGAQNCGGVTVSEPTIHELDKCANHERYDVVAVADGIPADKYLLKTTYFDGAATTCNDTFPKIYQYTHFGACRTGNEGSGKVEFVIESGSWTLAPMFALLVAFVLLALF